MEGEFTSIDTNDLTVLAHNLKEGVEVKDRKYHLKTYKSCFLGTEAVNWLIKQGIVATEEDAEIIGQEMIDNNLIYHVTKDESFRNKEFFYRFTQDDNTGAIGTGKSGEKISWAHVSKLLPKTSTNDQTDRNCRLNIKDEEQLNLGTLLHELEISPMDQYNTKLLDNVHPAAWINPDVDQFTLVVVGAGTGGLVSAASAAGVGARVALIEQHLMGGDCLNVGCVPSKALIRAARAVKEMQTCSEFGIELKEKPIVHFDRIMERLRKLRAEISTNDSYERFSKKLGVHLYQGKATFVGKNQVQVGDKTLKFQHAILATGASPALPPIDGLSTAKYLTNSNIFNLESLPERVCVIGAGPIGLELAQAFARFGSKVTCFVRGTDLLPKEDRDAASIIYDSLIEDGIEIKFKTKYCKIQSNSEGNKFKAPFYTTEVHVEIDGINQVFTCEALLIATGRRPNVEGIGLEAAGIKYDRRSGVQINEYLQTSNKNIYAVGDVCTPYQFTHMADFMARTAIRNALFFGRGKHSALLVPWATYTEPEVAHVGLYERDMKERNIAFDTYKKEFADVDRAICDGDTTGFVKIYCRKGTDTILGATIVNPNAGNMISELTLAMQHNIGLGSIAYVIHPYPTQAEGIRMCGDLYNKTRLTPLVKGLLNRIANRSLI